MIENAASERLAADVMKIENCHSLALPYPKSLNLQTLPHFKKPPFNHTTFIIFTLTASTSLTFVFASYITILLKSSRTSKALKHGYIALLVEVEIETVNDTRTAKPFDSFNAY